MNSSVVKVLLFGTTLLLGTTSLLSGALLLPMSAQAALPDQTEGQHLGVASCASSLCHGALRRPANAPLAMNEYILWSHQDRHSKAFEALVSGRGRALGARLGLASPESAPQCLACHSDHVAAAQRGPRFALADGVGCEACHGGAEHWIASHVASSATYPEDVRRGMYPTADLVERAQLCDSCHVGNEQKWATHAMMAAGHPRLTFELDTYLALEPAHYTLDASYQRRKPMASHTQTWAVGQLTAALTTLQALQGARLRAPGVFPELTLFSCTACHNSDLEHPKLARTGSAVHTVPGTVPLNEAYWRMGALIAQALDREAGARTLLLDHALQRAVQGSRAEIADSARALGSEFSLVEKRALSAPWDAGETSHVLAAVLDAGVQGEFRDYLGAEQAVMASELLLIDAGRAQHLRPQLDTLYRLLRTVDGYRSTEFVEALKALKSAP
jgi:hypothetical protein